MHFCIKLDFNTLAVNNTILNDIFVVTTGWSGNYALGDTEAFVGPFFATYNNNHLNKCQPSLSVSNQQRAATQTMYALVDATGALMTVTGSENLKHNIVVICGGESSRNGANNKCYGSSSSSFLAGDVPEVVGVMREFRMGAVSVVIQDRTILWVTGGIYGGPTDTTEWISSSSIGNATASGILSEGIRLPKRMAYHCLESISSDIAILYGGSELAGQQQSGLKETWTIGVNSSLFSQQMIGTSGFNDGQQ